MRLVRKIVSGDCTAENDQQESSARPEDCDPRRREGQPDRDKEHERSEVGEAAEEEDLAFGDDQVFPATGDNESVSIEEECRNEKTDGKLLFPGGNGWRVAFHAYGQDLREAVVESGQRLVDKHVGGGEQRDEETEAAEEN